MTIFSPSGPPPGTDPAAEAIHLLRHVGELSGAPDQTERAVGVLADTITQLRATLAALQTRHTTHTETAAKEIDLLTHQIHWNATLADHHDTDRRHLANALIRVRDVLTTRAHPDDKGIINFVGAVLTQSAHRRSQAQPPTVRDCERAGGGCNHPVPPPHAACDRLRQAAAGNPPPHTGGPDETTTTTAWNPRA